VGHFICEVSQHRWCLAIHPWHVLDVSRTTDRSDSRNIIFCGSTDHFHTVILEEPARIGKGIMAHLSYKQDVATRRVQTRHEARINKVEVGCCARAASGHAPRRPKA